MGRGDYNVTGRGRGTGTGRGSGSGSGSGNGSGRIGAVAKVINGMHTMPNVACHGPSFLC